MPLYVPFPIILLSQATVGVAVTGTTSETVLATITIPAGAMGLNGRIEVWSTWTNNSSGNSKSFAARFGASGAGTGGTQIWGSANTTNLGGCSFQGVCNRNSLSIQIGVGSLGGNSGVGSASPSAPPTMAVNTANASEVVLTGTLANAGDTITLEAYRAWLMPA